MGKLIPGAGFRVLNEYIKGFYEPVARPEKAVNLLFAASTVILANLPDPNRVLLGNLQYAFCLFLNSA
jgi:hypothetical protein